MSFHNSLFKAEILEPAKALLLGFPDAVDDVLNVKHVVSLAVASVAERHAWWVHLRNGCQSKMWRP